MEHDSVEMPPTPDTGMNLQNPTVAIDLFSRAATLNLEEPRRQGSTVHLPDTGILLMTGDLHDHGLNFQRIVKLASLHKYPDRHLILHELIHGESRINGRDISIRTMAKVAALKCAYPQQVHLMLGNHELAQLHGEGILKDNVSLVDAFEDGMEFIYANRTDDVKNAMNKLIRSMLLAVRCPNGILCSHSLPSPRKLAQFDTEVLNRVLTPEDLASGGSAYHMVWGRHHTGPLADKLAKAWDVKMFVMGHQPAEMGYETQGDNRLILASDHSHGVILPLRLNVDYDLDTLVGQLIPLASIAL